jgi:hypothetical protein
VYPQRRVREYIEKHAVAGEVVAEMLSAAAEEG